MATQGKQSDLSPAAIDTKGLHSTLRAFFKSAKKDGEIITQSIGNYIYQDYDGLNLLANLDTDALAYGICEINNLE